MRRENGVQVPSPDRIGLVGCVKRKQQVRAPARDLYISALFRGRRAYVERACGRWFILSAELGLTGPDEIIEPYDKSLNDSSVRERRRWSAEVLRELREKVGGFTGLTFEIHAGASYANYGLVNGLLAGGARVEQPTVGLSLGRQLQFYAQGRGAVDGKVATAIPADVAPAVSQTAGVIAPPTARTAPECDARALQRALDDLERDPTIVSANDWPADVTCLDRPGLYAWWVDESGAVDLSRGLGLTVAPGRIYAGQAGATFWPSGKTSDNTLGKRIGQKHLGGKVRMSTFRHTLVAILFEQIDVEVKASMRIAPASEQALTAWMREHLLVAVHPCDDRDTLSSLEHAMLKRLDPPLNLSHTAPTPVRKRLSKLRHKISHPGTGSGRGTRSET